MASDAGIGADELASDAVHRFYSGRGAQRYESRLPPLAGLTKRAGYRFAGIRPGESVLVFCCGTGLDFEPLQNYVGPTGRILGVDFSQDMLAICRARVMREGWDNVELICEDVTRFQWEDHFDARVDVGICTLGLSVIPNWTSAYRSLYESVRPGGRLVIADMRYQQGVLEPLNPLVVWASRQFGSTTRGHRNAGSIPALMSLELEQVKVKTLALGFYFVAWGTKAAGDVQDAQ